MPINIRIEHAADPKKPEAPEGIVTIYVNGKIVPLPQKGQVKVVTERPSDMLVHNEYLPDSDST